MDWYYMLNKERQGPTDVDTIKKLLQEGTLSPSSFVWNESMGQQWSHISDVPAFGIPRTIDPEKEAEINRNMAQKIAAEKRARAFRTIKIASLLLCLVGAGVFGWYWKSTAPLRQFGVNAANPIGSFESLDNHFTGVFQMDKQDVTEGPFLRNRPERLVAYVNPKCKRGASVSAQGSIIVGLDGSNRLRCMICIYPTPGARGYSIVNASITSIFAHEYWTMLTGQEEPRFAKIDVATVDQDQDILTLSTNRNMDKGSYGTFLNDRLRTIWVEYGLNNASTVIYFEVRP